MHLIVCLDERQGLSFCGRRLSRDAVLNDHMLRTAAGHKLWMNAYSGKMFLDGTVCVDEHFLEKAAEGDYCFVENSDLPQTNTQLESIICYHWNRVYPSTVKFPQKLLEGMRLTQTEEFPGSSHEKITMQRFTL